MNTLQPFIIYLLNGLTISQLWHIARHEVYFIELHAKIKYIKSEEKSCKDEKDFLTVGC